MIQKDIKTTYIKATTMRKYELQSQLVLLIKADQHSALEMFFFFFLKLKSMRMWCRKTLVEYSNK